MARSPLLWLYLATRSQGHRAGQQPAPAPPRPDGPLVWVHATQISARAGAAQLARHLVRSRPGLQVLLTKTGQMPDAAGLAKGITAAAPPDGDSPEAAQRFLGHWRPDLAVFIGAALPPAPVVIAADAGIPLLLADARFAPAERRWSWRRPLLRALLSRFALLMVQDQASAAALTGLGLPPERITVPGTMSETPEPLGYSESERATIATVLRARPVWLAIAVPETEEPFVLAAHAHALRHAHRMLLILLPEDPARATPLADRLAAEGWDIARRSHEGEPDDDTQIFIADDLADAGLWYRLAPVCYMGGTLSGAAINTRSPLEPAALGSAILHGPRTAPYAADYARLGEARAARPLANPDALAEAVADLIAPDRAAMLAHNAWAVTSGGAGVADAICKAVLATLKNPFGKVA